VLPPRRRSRRRRADPRHRDRRPATAHLAPRTSAPPCRTRAPSRRSTARSRRANSPPNRTVSRRSQLLPDFARLTELEAHHDTRRNVTETAHERATTRRSHVERVREPSDRTVVDHHLAYTPPATDARVASAAIASSLISTPALGSVEIRRLFNDSVECPNDESPGRLPKWVLTRAFLGSGRRDSNPRPSPWQGELGVTAVQGQSE
jgi:hypothetical protein